MIDEIWILQCVHLHPDGVKCEAIAEIFGTTALLLRGQVLDLRQRGLLRSVGVKRGTRYFLTDAGREALKGGAK